MAFSDVKWSNIYPAPSSVGAADALSQNIAACQNSYGNYSYLPFNNYGNFGSYMPYGGYGGYSSYGNPFMETNYNYSRDKDGNITSNFSQHPDYLGIGISSLGIIANAAGNAIVGAQQAKVMKQQQMFENMAYQQQAAQMAQMQKHQMNQQSMQNTMGMIMNMMVMQKMMGSLGEA